MARKSLVDPSISLVASRHGDSFLLRAIVQDWPGGASELYLQRVDFGDEAEPYVVARETKYVTSASRVTRPSWDDEGFHFVGDEDELEGEPGTRYFVRATAETFAAKIIRDE